MTKRFYGWWVTAAAFCTFGIAVGIPYYNMPFFYDYYAKEFSWPIHYITLGFPVAALLTLWVGPLLVPRFSQRKLIIAGTALTLIAVLGLSRMTGELWIYYLLWFLYTFGYIISGPIPHQVIISHWFKKNRGTAMGIVYVGVGLFGSFGSLAVKPLAENYGWRTALVIIACTMVLAWPLALIVLRDKPEEKGQTPDGLPVNPNYVPPVSRSLGYLMAQPIFWLLLLGSFCSIGAIGAINQHMKLAFKDQGFLDQKALNAVWTTASVGTLWSSIAGRLLIGKLSDIFPMKWVMLVTYFVVAGSIPLLRLVHPADQSMVYVFAIIFGFAMGADYMLIPLMAAKQFGVNSLARAMAVLLPINTIGQTWVPQGVSILRDHYGNYSIAMMAVLVLAMVGAISVALLPKEGAEDAVAVPAEPVRV